MLLGIWKNFEEMEMNISIDELRALLAASHEREYRHHKFLAAIQGIDLEAEAHKDTKERFEEIKRRADARLQGKTEDELIMDILGLDAEIEE